MNITHKINKLVGKNSLNNLDMVITRISFNLKGEISTPIVYEITKEFSIFLQSPIQDNFIPYSNLTEEIVSAWIKTNPAYESLCGFITKELEKKINPNQEGIKEFDFENSIFPWIENPL
jgi:hypothetical protein